MMKIEYWGDYVCPFCYIGITRLKKCIKEMGLDDQAEITMRSFELDRDTPLTVGFNAAEHFAFKYGMPLEIAAKRVERISQMGKEEGIIQMDYASTHSTNTFDAHRLTKYASAHGNIRIQDLLYHAFFCDLQNIGKREVLLMLSERAGLDCQDVMSMFESDQYTDEVRTDEEQASLLGIRMVPHFVINGKEQISGSASPEEMNMVLQRCMEVMKNDTL